MAMLTSIPVPDGSAEAHPFPVKIYFASGALVAELFLTETQTVMEVKQCLNEIKDVPRGAQDLVFMERVLVDSVTLKQAGVCLGASLLLVCKGYQRVCDGAELRAALPTVCMYKQTATIGVQTGRHDDEEDAIPFNFNDDGPLEINELASQFQTNQSGLAAHWVDSDDVFEATDVTAEVAVLPGVRYLELMPGNYAVHQRTCINAPVDIIAAGKPGDVVLHGCLILPKHGFPCRLSGFVMNGQVVNADAHILLDVTILDEEEEEDIDFDLFG